MQLQKLVLPKYNNFTEAWYKLCHSAMAKPSPDPLLSNDLYPGNKTGLEIPDLFQPYVILQHLT